MQSLLSISNEYREEKEAEEEQELAGHL